jgi:hypothetical protein
MSLISTHSKDPSPPPVAPPAAPAPPAPPAAPSPPPTLPPSAPRPAALAGVAPGDLDKALYSNVLDRYRSELYSKANARTAATATSESKGFFARIGAFLGF